MRNLFGCATGLLAAGLLVLPVGSAAAGPRTPGEPALGVFDGEALRRQRAELAARLSADQAAGGAAVSVVRVSVNAADRAAVAQQDEPRLKVGVVKAVGLEVRLGSAPPALGALDHRADGWVWTGAVESAGAVALRLRFASVSLPRGVELYVYNELGQAFGPYIRRGPGGAGEFWSHTVLGQRVIVQLAYRGADAAGAAGASRLNIAEVGQLMEPFPLGVLGGGGGLGEAFCSFNEPCVQNAECSQIPGAILYAQDAVAQILFQSGGFFYICSGGLLVDTDAGSQIPYFLTANHCISKNNEAASMEAFFQFTTPCNGPCYDPDGVVPSTLGSTINAKNRISDYTLLRLSQPAPGGSSFLGWDATAVAFADGTPLFRVSHPGGAPQAYSEHAVDIDRPTCGGWPRGGWIYSSDTFGATEGGSSGSPVLDADGEVVGQLSGACGFDVGDPCNAAANATVDGAFANYFSQVEPFLDPSGGGGCLPQGAACTSDAECCSNKCRGPAGNKTCR